MVGVPLRPCFRRLDMGAWLDPGKDPEQPASLPPPPGLLGTVRGSLPSRTAGAAPGGPATHDRFHPHVCSPRRSSRGHPHPRPHRRKMSAPCHKHEKKTAP